MNQPDRKERNKSNKNDATRQRIPRTRSKSLTHAGSDSSPKRERVFFKFLRRKRDSSSSSSDANTPMQSLRKSKPPKQSEHNPVRVHKRSFLSFRRRSKIKRGNKSFLKAGKNPYAVESEREGNIRALKKASSDPSNTPSFSFCDEDDCASMRKGKLVAKKIPNFINELMKEYIAHNTGGKNDKKIKILPTDLQGSIDISFMGSNFTQGPFSNNHLKCWLLTLSIALSLYDADKEIQLYIGDDIAFEEIFPGNFSKEIADETKSEQNFSMGGNPSLILDALSPLFFLGAITIITPFNNSAQNKSNISAHVKTSRILFPMLIGHFCGWIKKPNDTNNYYERFMLGQDLLKARREEYSTAKKEEVKKNQDGNIRREWPQVPISDFITISDFIFKVEDDANLPVKEPQAAISIKQLIEGIVNHSENKTITLHEKLNAFPFMKKEVLILLSQGGASSIDLSKIPLNYNEVGLIGTLLMYHEKGKDLDVHLTGLKAFGQFLVFLCHPSSISHTSWQNIKITITLQSPQNLKGQKQLTLTIDNNKFLYLRRVFCMTIKQLIANSSGTLGISDMIYNLDPRSKPIYQALFLDSFEALFIFAKLFSEKNIADTKKLVRDIVCAIDIELERKYNVQKVQFTTSLKEVLTTVGATPRPRLQSESDESFQYDLEESKTDNATSESNTTQESQSEANDDESSSDVGQVDSDESKSGNTKYKNNLNADPSLSGRLRTTAAELQKLLDQAHQQKNSLPHEFNNFRKFISHSEESSCLRQYRANKLANKSSNTGDSQMDKDFKGARQFLSNAFSFFSETQITTQQLPKKQKAPCHAPYTARSIGAGLGTNG